MTEKPAKTTSKAVAKTTGGVIPGLEGIGQEMLIIPRLKLVQKNSVEVDDGVAPGSFINSVTKEVVAGKDKSIIILPVQQKITRIYFKEFDLGGGMYCQSIDGITGVGEPGGTCKDCPHFEWPSDEERNKKGKDKKTSPDCTEYINIFCVVRGYDFPMPITASFGRSAYDAGRRLINFFYFDAQKHQKSPWNFGYELKAVSKENDFGKFYVPEVKPGGKATKPEIEQGDLYYKLINTAQIQIHEDEEEMLEEQSRMAEDDPFGD